MGPKGYAPMENNSLEGDTSAAPKTLPCVRNLDRIRLKVYRT